MAMIPPNFANANVIDLGKLRQLQVEAEKEPPTLHPAYLEMLGVIAKHLPFVHETGEGLMFKNDTEAMMAMRSVSMMLIRVPQEAMMLANAKKLRDSGFDDFQPDKLNPYDADVVSQVIAWTEQQEGKVITSDEGSEPTE